MIPVGGRRRSVKNWIASLIRRDMVDISVSETNEGSASAGRPLRRDPVLTPAQLAAIVTDPAWATVIARVPPDRRYVRSAGWAMVSS